MDPQNTAQTSTQATPPVATVPTNPPPASSNMPPQNSKSFLSKNLIIAVLVLVIIVMAGGLTFFVASNKTAMESKSTLQPTITATPTTTVTPTTQTNTTAASPSANNGQVGQNKIIGVAGKPVILANGSFALSLTASDLHMHVAPTQSETGALQYAYKDDYKNIQLAAIKITLTNNSDNTFIIAQSDFTAMPTTGQEEVVFDSTALGEANNFPRTYSMNPHQTISGYIYFILPATDNNTILLYKPYAINDTTKPLIEIQM